MADHLSEEEQIEAIKNWWKEYWASIVLPIVLVAVGYFGWSLWQDERKETARLGGAAYQELVQALETAPGAPLSDEQRATGKVLAAGIAKDFDGTLYSDHANLILARIAVEEKQLDLAESTLEKVTNDGSNEAMKNLAKSRLARVKIAQGELDEALSLVSSSDVGEYNALFAEVRGDAYAAQGNVDAAKTAYQEAIDKLPQEQANRRSIIQLKRDGASIIAANVSAAGEAPASDPASETPATEPEVAPSAESAVPEATTDPSVEKS